VLDLAADFLAPAAFFAADFFAAVFLAPVLATLRPATFLARFAGTGSTTTTTLRARLVAFFAVAICDYLPCAANT
jgi:hypothetical protein